ncbi:GGDEF domain-containing protein [Sulfobacillus harzensis]|uniref:GGDEF domain-containing protein n=1 Tax=Sulfobacillus harzensis TaxID=2729629 RepID=A0A7Y0L8Q2_9FIRM|nr:GGDEF domain-containing protein [Sulfobacillus harzensis]NMP24881.1 GGDEF domain-containing protein [Sulfobacillus harzensis]
MISQPTGWWERGLFLLSVLVTVGGIGAGLRLPGFHRILPWWSTVVLVVATGVIMTHRTPLTNPVHSKSHNFQPRLNVEFVLAVVIGFQYGIGTGLAVIWGSLLVQSGLRVWMGCRPDRPGMAALIGWFDENPHTMKPRRIAQTLPYNLILDGATLVAGVGAWKTLALIGWPGLPNLALPILTARFILVATWVIGRLMVALGLAEVANMSFFLVLARVPVKQWHVAGRLLPAMMGPAMVVIVPFALLLHGYGVIGYFVFTVLYWQFQKRLSLQRKFLEQSDELRVQQRSALTDFLSGLPNRRAMEEYAARLFAAQIPTMVAIIDADHFKRVNDAWGHDVGDFVIRAVSSQLADQFRTTEAPWPDMVARWGGEEFAVLLPFCPWDAAVERLDTMRQRVQDNPMRRDADTVVHLTISVGITVWTPGTAATIVEVLEQEADAAVYTAKHDGRNRIVPAPDGVARWTAWHRAHPGSLPSASGNRQA